MRLILFATCNIHKIGKYISGVHLKGGLQKTVNKVFVGRQLTELIYSIVLTPTSPLQVYVLLFEKSHYFKQYL